MLIGYSKDDRIMDPQGPYRLYQAAVNSKREMVEGTGHSPRLRMPEVPESCNHRSSRTGQQSNL
jgi:hypothetical protein